MQSKKKTCKLLEARENTSEQFLVLILFAERMARVFSMTRTAKEKRPMHFQFTFDSQDGTGVK